MAFINDISAVVFLLMVGLPLLFLMYTVKPGTMPSIRRIAGLDALDEMAGRAAETGRPIFSVLTSGAGVLTLAHLAILSYIADRAIPSGVDVYCGVRRPVCMGLAKEVIKEAYVRAGAEDAYKEENIRWLSDQQMSYAVGVIGMMRRIKAGVNILIGGFSAEALVIAEAGNLTGAMQIAGGGSTYAMIAACDYVLIGEEVYAAGAYLSEIPAQRAAFRGQDLGKILALSLLVLGVILATMGGPNLITEIITFK